MLGRMNDFKVFSGSSHPILAQQITQYLNIELGKIALGTFPDGEIDVQILESVRGMDVFVLQSIGRTYKAKEFLFKNFLEIASVTG